MVNGRTVTLQDANDAVFDSAAFVKLDDGAGGAGTLGSANGLTLNFGGNITGYGTVNTPNDPFRPLINNGHITGNSAAESVTLSGYVKGVGTLDHVVITGTNALASARRLSISAVSHTPARLKLSWRAAGPASST